MLHIVHFKRTDRETVATGYGLHCPGFGLRWGEREFLFSALPGLKWPGRGVGHPSEPSAEVRMTRAIHPLSLCTSMSRYGETFTLHFKII